MDVAEFCAEGREDAARTYFRCLDALVAAGKQNQVEGREVERKDR